MSATEQPIVYISESVVPAANALDAGTVGIRIPVTCRLNVIEFGVAVFGATSTGTSLVVTLKGEPLAVGSPVSLSVLTGSSTLATGKRGRRICDVEVDPTTYTFLTLTASGGAAGSTGVLYIKARQGGSFGTETNTVDFTS